MLKTMSVVVPFIRNVMLVGALIGFVFAGYEIGPQLIVSVELGLGSNVVGSEGMHDNCPSFGSVTLIISSFAKPLLVALILYEIVLPPAGISSIPNLMKLNCLVWKLPKSLFLESVPDVTGTEYVPGAAGNVCTHPVSSTSLIV